ncbi:uncharacterized protein Ecym_2527 [Eremothecium cymbalariae DBVPG|uniref:Uncharacterized protein n=1 Tax=Eremothecium cymbalariae (strain CBS 270.75 / DBVPG 7215 / KCTC 17166 / NRRL Y-17582) TaxID=931890 RepID=G8JQ90_ERECY|nr:Hypothetical protein Ecym_2527 [Eremothecium cymbalariae DBVPG\
MLYLFVTAVLSENIKCFYPTDNEQQPAEYTFQIVCTSCRETHDSPVRINRFEKHVMPGSRGEASFLMKCRFCNKECSINLERTEEDLYNVANESNVDVIKRSIAARKKRGLKNFDSNSAVWLALDCRGCDVLSYIAADTKFSVELVSGKVMECVFDEGENEWYDYDDDAGEEVSITDLKLDIFKGK